MALQLLWRFFCILCIKNIVKILRLAVSVSEVSVSEPIPWYRYRYRFHPVSVPIPVTVVILQVISLFIIITVQDAIVITLRSVNIVKDENRVCCFMFLSI